MVDKLFEVQDVSKINNVKLKNYTSKAINETTSEYKQYLTKNNIRVTPVDTRHISPMSKNNSNSKLGEDLDPSQAEIDKYVAELGKDGPDFVAFKKLCINRRSLNDERGGACRRLFCCRVKNFDIMMKEAKNHVKEELDIVKYIQKQRTHSNLLWGLTTPWQRSVCR